MILVRHTSDVSVPEGKPVREGDNVSIIEDEVAQKRAARKRKVEVGFTVDADALARAIGPVVRATAVGQRSAAMPVLAAVRITVGETAVTVYGTDLETSVEATLPATGCTPGVLAISAKSLERFAQAAAGEATFTLTGASVVASAGDFVARFPAVDPTGFPNALEANGGTLVPVDALAIRQAIKRTVCAASRDEVRPILTAVLFHAVDGKLAVAATDSYRIGTAIVAETPLSDRPLLVPAKTLVTVDKLIGDRDTIDVAVGARTISFRVDGTTVQVRLVEGDFPNVGALIPKGELATLSLSREAFTAAVEKAARFATDDKTAVRLSISPAGVTVALVEADVADVDTDVSCQWAEGKFEVAFNPTYLLAGLRTIEADTVELRFQVKDGKPSALQPAVVKGDGDAYCYLMMPVRVSS